MRCFAIKDILSVPYRKCPIEGVFLFDSSGARPGSFRTGDLLLTRSPPHYTNPLPLHHSAPLCLLPPLVLPTRLLSSTLVALSHLVQSLSLLMPMLTTCVLAARLASIFLRTVSEVGDEEIENRKRTKLEDTEHKGVSLGCLSLK